MLIPCWSKDCKKGQERGKEETLIVGSRNNSLKCCWDQVTSRVLYNFGLLLSWETFLVLEWGERNERPSRHYKLLICTLSDWNQFPVHCTLCVLCTSHQLYQFVPKSILEVSSCTSVLKLIDIMFLLDFRNFITSLVIRSLSCFLVSVIFLTSTLS